MEGSGRPKSDECVKVVVRIRPLSRKEVQDGHSASATVDESRGEVCVKNPRADDREAPKSFFFDSVFGDGVTQKRVYEVCGAPLVESVLEGYNGTIFAYGQTGAGKTHTMEGYPDPPEQRGIIPNSFQHIFDKIALADNVQYLVRASYLEIYNEEIRDLLSKDPKNSLDLKENADSGVYVKDLTSFVVKSAMEIDHVMQAGKKNRSVGATLMNQTSSRSHSIFTIVVECSDLHDKNGHIRVGKLNLVDLAGSERQSKTGATGDRLKEATKINLSLSALGNVISALVDGRSQHIPYRDSKLTRLLQDSLGGNTKTVMCANCGPAEYNYDETVSTLRYANRAKNIKNKPKINEDPKDAMLREFQEEIRRLKAQLAEGGGASGAGGKHVIFVDGQPVEGVSEEEYKKLQAEADKRERELRAQAAEDMQRLLDAHARTAEEREALKARLEAEAAERRKMEKGKASLASKLKAMEEKLIQGGEIMDKAARQEAQLRQAQQELELQRAQEAALARELAEREEGLADLDRDFQDLQEEVEVKTRKLKKLWGKYQAAQAEVADIQAEFQGEREDLLDAIRQLSRQLKLKDLIITNFVPPEEARRVERRAEWSEEAGTWTIPFPELAGNVLRGLVARPISSEALRRPETEFARQRRQVDPNPRYRSENVLQQELDPPERTTQPYEGPGMASRVAPVLAMPLDADEEEVTFTVAQEAVPQPYLHYENGDAGDRGDDGDNGANGDAGGRPKTAFNRSSARKAGSSSATKRPKSAARRRRSGEAGGEENGGGGGGSGGGGGGGAIEFKEDEEMYPTARGLVRK
ncbi:kinesin-like protein [Tribonema minus]|uniref:Kinesin-like protein n=1 Tax=Tribonema minus TaxID=303371 RepID=A0A835YNE8_9STRA|nr:kinesin-like protein [Tribonema minus]